jgi:hypothetical protein
MAPRGAVKVGRAVVGPAMLALSLPAITAVRAPSAGAAMNGLASKPYMGWSSWSLESTNYPDGTP